MWLRGPGDERQCWAVWWAAGEAGGLWEVLPGLQKGWGLTLQPLDRLMAHWVPLLCSWAVLLPASSCRGVAGIGTFLGLVDVDTGMTAAPGSTAGCWATC